MSGGGISEKNYYEMLGVSRQATTKQIKEAYREIARVYHPDSNFYDEIIADAPSSGGMDVFKKITSAYNTLIHDEKRAAYNQTLPPELVGWEDPSVRDDEETFHTPKKQPSSMGTFGNMKRDEIRKMASDDNDTLRPLSEVIHVKGGFFKKLKKIFSR